MQMRDVLFDPPFAGIAVQLFVPFQTVALADVVRQLLNQNGGIALAIVLNGTADIAI